MIVEFFMTTQITVEDMRIINKALEEGHDVRIRKNDKGILILQEDASVIRRKNAKETQ